MKKNIAVVGVVVLIVCAVACFKHCDKSVVITTQPAAQNLPRLVELGAGKCTACGEWNTLVEETDAGPPPGSGISARAKGRVVKLESLKGSTQEAPRFSTSIEELNRVTGGGIVPGSAMLIGGEPGIGKSTLLLQLTANLARSGRKALYFSGEEAIAQVLPKPQILGNEALSICSGLEG